MSDEKIGTESVIRDLNEFLKGPVEEYINNQVKSEPKEAAPQEAQAAQEASTEVAEQQVEAQAEAHVETATESNESDDDKTYNFRRLREQNQEYKSKLGELEQFKYEATAAFKQLYEQNQQLQQALQSNQKQVAPAAEEDESNLTDVERAIRKQIKALNEPELKRIQELREAEESRLGQVRAQELMSATSRTVDEIIEMGKVDLGPQTEVFKNFIGDLILNAADKYNVKPQDARDAFLNAFEMYHQAKKSQEKAVSKSVVEQAKRVASPISKPSAAVSESTMPARLPSTDDLKKMGYRGNVTDMIFSWQRDQLNKKR